MRDVFQQAEQPENTPRLAPRARTARGWLRNMGLHYKRIGKGVYIDGHEREDFSQYRQQEFVPRWLEMKKRLCRFSAENPGDPWQVPADLGEERALVLVTHDEATFSANDAPSYGWLKDGQVPLRPKGRGKGIMVSAFLTPGGILAVPGKTSRLVEE